MAVLKLEFWWIQYSWFAVSRLLLNANQTAYNIHCKLMYTLWIYSFTLFEQHRSFSKPLGIIMRLNALGKATLYIYILNKTSLERVRYGRRKLLWCYFISIYCARWLTAALGIPLITVLGFMWLVRSVEQQIPIYCCIICNIYWCCITLLL